MNTRDDSAGRNLVICCDGTWNSPKQQDGGVPSPTNVWKTYSLVADHDARGRVQKKYYRLGVGTTGSVWRRAFGGAFGLGISEDIESAYKWLAETYEDDDRIYVFGFSRGAYTARSLAGMIGKIGLLDLTNPVFDDELKWQLAKNAIAAYRSSKTDSVTPDEWRKLWVKDADEGGFNSRMRLDSQSRIERIPIKFLGVWDTVGALGIPEDWALVDHIMGDRSLLGWGLGKLGLRNRKADRFHDTELGSNVQKARHAVSLDEMRVDFVPTMWTKVDTRRNTVRQRWFPGVHGDIGGSYRDHGLGDAALKWVLKAAVGDAAKATDLTLRPGAIASLKPNPKGVLHDSVNGTVFRNRQTRPRAAPNLGFGWMSGDVAKTTRARREDPPDIEPAYWRTINLGLDEGTDSHTLDVTSKEHWVRTGVYLRKEETYRLKAKGEWLDASIKAGPDGAIRGFQIGKLFYGAAAVSEGFRRVYRKCSGNPFAENLVLRAGRRAAGLPWFSLIGEVANGAGEDETTKRRVAHEQFLIGRDREFSPKKSGYLYCYANDAWGYYRNNRGRVRLTIQRIT